MFFLPPLPNKLPRCGATGETRPAAAPACGGESPKRPGGGERPGGGGDEGVRAHAPTVSAVIECGGRGGAWSGRKSSGLRAPPHCGRARVTICHVSPHDAGRSAYASGSPPRPPRGGERGAPPVGRRSSPVSRAGGGCAGPPGESVAEGGGGLSRSPHFENTTVAPER